MNGLDTQVARRLATKIDEEIARETDFLARGAASSFDDYRHRVGQIKALIKARELLKESERELLGPSPTENR